MATFYMSGISLIVQYLNNQGLLSAGCTLNTYVGGSAGTPVTTYTDSTGIVPNPNPMTLSSAGRPATASGAATAFWVPGGTLVQLLVNDALGNLLVFLDNVPAFNDLTNSSSSLQTLLASAASSNVSGSGPVAGVDLVANAVKSYDIIASVRAANAPVLVSGQTLNIEIQGGAAVGDGLGGFFYWAPSSAATDDGRTVLKPNSITVALGRWLRYYPLGVEQLIVKTANQSVTNSTVLVNDTSLTVPLLAGASYRVSLRLNFLGLGAIGAGWKAQLTYSGSIAQNGGCAGVGVGNGLSFATAGAVGVAVTSGNISQTTPDPCHLDYTFTTGTSGTLTVQFAQNLASVQAIQLDQGSLMSVTRVA